MRRPVTVYTRSAFVTGSYFAAEGFDARGARLGRSAHVSPDLDRAMLRNPRSHMVDMIGTESDAIRWVALGVVPDGGAL